MPAASASGEAFNEVVRVAVTGVLQPAGFRKSATNYHRRRGSCVQVVNIQPSRASSLNEKRFYINVGLAFDELCKLTGLPVLEKPREYECDDRGTRDRLEKLVQSADDEWRVGSSVEAAAVTMRLRSAIAELVRELDAVDGLRQFRAHRWFDRFRPKQENAQALYVLGDHAAAMEEVRQLARLFWDRQNASRAEWWIERLGLKDLQAHGDSGAAAS